MTMKSFGLPYRPTVKGEIDRHKQVSFVWDETHLVDVARLVLDQPL